MTRMDTDVLFSPTDVTEDAEILFEFREDVFRLEHCFQDCCQGMSQVFYGVTHDIDIVVDDEETVVCLMWQLYHLYLGILAIVLCHLREPFIGALLQCNELAVYAVTIEEIVPEDSCCPDAELCPSF